MSQISSISSPRQSRRNLLISRNSDIQDKGTILLLSETIFVEPTSELGPAGKLLKTTYLDICVIFRAILLNFSIKKSERVAAVPGKHRISSVHNRN